MELNQFEPNKIYTDEFGRVSGIFLVDKPVGKTSHDMVYEYRRKLQTKKVGHAGALDPFATGLLIVLAGKALKLSDQFLNLGKEYEAEIALGFKTDTLDTEGVIVANKIKDVGLNESDVQSTLKIFMPEYSQEVPIYSSVKVNGNKLRELVRKGDDCKFVNNDDGSRTAQFIKAGNIFKEVVIPRKVVKIYSLELVELKQVSVSDYNFPQKFVEELSKNNITSFYSLTIKTHVSKGTYIRKLAEDIGEKLDMPGMLINLRRTKVGEYKI